MTTPLMMPTAEIAARRAESAVVSGVIIGIEIIRVGVFTPTVSG
jgi:hypothetical protein